MSSEKDWLNNLFKDVVKETYIINDQRYSLVESCLSDYSTYKWEEILIGLRKKNLLTESMKKDVINLMVINLLNSFRMCSTKNMNELLPNLFQELKENDNPNFNGLIKIYTEIVSKDSNTIIKDKIKQKEGMCRHNISYSQIQSKIKMFNAVTKNLYDAEYLKTVDFESFFPVLPDKNSENIKYYANIADYYKAIGNLFKGDKNRFAKYKKESDEHLDIILLNFSLNPNNINIDTTNAKYLLKILMDKEDLDMLDVLKNKILTNVTNKEILPFQSKIEKSYERWEVESYNLNGINHMLERIKVNPLDLNKQVEIAIKMEDSITVELNINDMIQYFLKNNNKVLSKDLVHNKLEIFFYSKKTMNNNMNKDDVYNENLFNLIKPIKLEKIGNDWFSEITMIIPENYFLTKDELKKILNKEIVDFLNEKPGIEVSLIKDFMHSTRESKIMKKDVADINLTVKKAKLNKF